MIKKKSPLYKTNTHVDRIPVTAAAAAAATAAEITVNNLQTTSSNTTIKRIIKNLLT